MASPRSDHRRLPALAVVAVAGVAAAGGVVGAPALDGPERRVRVEEPRLVAVEPPEGIPARTFSYPVDASRKLILYTNGVGVGLLDYDRDGRLDVFVANGTDLEAAGTGGDTGSPGQMLWRGGSGLRFESVGGRAGVDEILYGQGVAVGDVDNDGWPDVHLTAFGANRLYRNRGDGTFAEVGESWGVADPAWGASAAFTDADADGWLDLFVVRYLDWSPAMAVRHEIRGHVVFGSPSSYPPLSDRLYLNARGRFEDRSARWGLERSRRRGLGVAVADGNGDGRPDLLVANDGEPNDHWVHDGSRFVNDGLLTGLALGEEGAAERGMGVDWGDYDRDGWPDCVVSNFEDEPYALYRSLAGKLWTHRSYADGIGASTRRPLGFGAHLVDLDSDGWPDLFFANGHVFDNVADFRPASTFAQPDQVFHNHEGRFHLVPDAVEPGPFGVQAGRASAVGDVDGDGDVDVVVTNVNGPVVLYENRGARGRSLGLHLTGVRANRSGHDVRVTVVAGARRYLEWSGTAGSFLAASEARLHFGLGEWDGEVEARLRWGSGAVDAVRLGADVAEAWLREGKGVVALRRRAGISMIEAQTGKTVERIIED